MKTLKENKKMKKYISAILCVCLSIGGSLSGCTATGDSPPLGGINCAKLKGTTVFKCTAQLTPSDQAPPQGHCGGLVNYICSANADNAMLIFASAGGLLDKALGSNPQFNGYRLDTFCSDTGKISFMKEEISHPFSVEKNASDGSLNSSDPELEPQGDPSPPTESGDTNFSTTTCEPDPVGSTETTVPGAVCNWPVTTGNTISSCENCLINSCISSYCVCFNTKNPTCVATADCFLNGNTYPTNPSIDANAFAGCMQLSCTQDCPNASMCVSGM